jgi:hypothetical protein
MVFKLLLLLFNAIAVPINPEHILSGIKREIEIAESVVKKAVLNDRVLRSHLKPVEANFLKVSPSVAALFGKSHQRFTLPTMVEKRVAINEIYERMIDHGSGLNFLADAMKQTTTNSQEYTQTLDKIKAIQKVLKNYDAIINEIDSLPTISPAAAWLFGKSHESFEIPTKNELEIAISHLKWRMRQTSASLDLAYDQAMDERNPGEQSFSDASLRVINALKAIMMEEKIIMKELESMPVRANT